MLLYLAILFSSLFSLIFYFEFFCILISFPSCPRSISMIVRRLGLQLSYLLAITELTFFHSLLSFVLLLLPFYLALSAFLFSLDFDRILISTTRGTIGLNVFLKFTSSCFCATYSVSHESKAFEQTKHNYVSNVNE